MKKKKKTSRLCHTVKRERRFAGRKRRHARITLSDESRMALMRLADANATKRAMQTDLSETCRTGRALLVANSKSAPHERYLASGQAGTRSSHSSQTTQGFRLPSVGLLMQNPS